MVYKGYCYLILETNTHFYCPVCVLKVPLRNTLAVNALVYIDTSIITISKVSSGFLEM